MYLGAIVGSGEAAQIIRAPLHPCTRALASAVPVPNPDRPRNRFVLRGDLPTATDLPQGCRLRGRCPLAAPVCTQPLPLREVAPGHHVASHMV